MELMNLVGHSGCNIEIVNVSNKLLVRKCSSDLNYNLRLKKQCDKQKSFVSEKFHIPKIYSEGYTESDLFWFDMEYISGITLSAYMGTIPLHDIGRIINPLLSIIPEKYIFDETAKYSIKEKIEDLRKKIKNKKKYIKYLDYLSHYDWSLMIKSDCHGDFTLENMIISDGKIYLIDFLDSFYNSWMIDYAKILQDVDLGWSYRYTEMDANLKIRLIIIKKIILDKIESLYRGKEIMDTIYHLLLLNMLRIVPYIKDDITEIFVSDKCKYLYKSIGGSK